MRMVGVRQVTQVLLMVLQGVSRGRRWRGVRESRSRRAEVVVVVDGRGRYASAVIAAAAVGGGGGGGGGGGNARGVKNISGRRLCSAAAVGIGAVVAAASLAVEV